MNKAGAQIRFPRKKKDWMDEENSAIARKTREAAKILFPDDILSRHSLQIITAECLRKHECFAKIWRPLRQDIGFFEDCRKFLTHCKRRVKLGVALISRFF